MKRRTLAMDLGIDVADWVVDRDPTTHGSDSLDDEVVGGWRIAGSDGEFQPVSSFHVSYSRNLIDVTRHGDSAPRFVPGSTGDARLYFDVYLGSGLDKLISISQPLPEVEVRIPVAGHMFTAAGYVTSCSVDGAVDGLMVGHVSVSCSRPPTIAPEAQVPAAVVASVVKAARRALLLEGDV
jgi:hypothetical protein